ncbi:hypothetical protein [uncultured Eudoraea sp.]|uniref:hypothetical protein n=1 Tax=uncultured Eudoraea sp. TaxID=1035614 RepID=UPI00261CDA8A|nr:hypothetical protein [uncultured Eudoraea sp.]
MKNFKKNVPFALFFTYAALFVFTACGDQKTKEAETVEKIEEVKAPEQIISVEQARKMYQSYTERRVPLIQNYEKSQELQKQEQPKVKDSFDVARYVYYDYQTIKDYLAYIEQEAAKADIEISTLRFYFSNYPDEARFEDGNPVIHPRQNSIFILPASTVDNAQYGFYLKEQEDGSLRPAYLSWDLSPYIPEGMGAVHKNDKSFASMGPNFNNANTSTMSPLQFGGGSTILNEGSSAPPPRK